MICSNQLYSVKRATVRRIHMFWLISFHTFIFKVGAWEHMNAPSPSLAPFSRRLEFSIIDHIHCIRVRVQCLSNQDKPLGSSEALRKLVRGLSIVIWRMEANLLHAWRHTESCASSHAPQHNDGQILIERVCAAISDLRRSLGARWQHLTQNIYLDPKERLSTLYIWIFCCLLGFVDLSSRKL